MVWGLGFRVWGRGFEALRFCSEILSGSEGFFLKQGFGFAIPGMRLWMLPVLLEFQI